MAKVPGVLAEFKRDLPASIVVFLVALPLCLGIALASGAEPIAGLIAGIVGGIVVGAASGSPLGVSGPAAGLSVIVLHAIRDLGGYPTFLAALLLAAGIQMLLGALRAGVLAYYFPSAVIKGMLSGIGVIIILKQVPHALGYNKGYEGDMGFVQPGDETTLSALWTMLNYVNEGSILVALVALAILLLWDRPFIKKTRLGLIPGPLLAVSSGILLGRLMPAKGGFAMDSTFFVNFPDFSLPSAFSVLPLPDWAAVSHPAVWKVAFSLAIVASIETLLCVEATDKMDPLKRVTPTDRELVAQGIGNGLSALLGGLPVTQVIVRSSANVQNGGRSKLSAILHGAWLLGSVLLIPGVLRSIPLASLASILLVVGYKLAHPQVIASLWKAGRSQFIPFAATLAGVVFTDLLTGVLIGLGIGIFTILHNNYRIPFHFDPRSHVPGRPIRIELSEDVSFLNKASILRTLDSLPRGARVFIDGRRTVNLDPDVREIIQDAVTRSAQTGVTLEVGGLSTELGEKSEPPIRMIHRIVQNQVQECDELRGEGASTADMAVMERLGRQRMSPSEAFEMLVAGNRRFMTRPERERVLQTRIEETAGGRFPLGVVLSCLDSRVPTELVFDLGVGDVLTLRLAGHTLTPDILGSMEFACKTAGARSILVLGHTRCGAAKGDCDGIRRGHPDGLPQKREPVVRAVPESGDQGWGNAGFVEHLMRSIPDQSPILRELVEQGKICLAAGICDEATGEVRITVPPGGPEHPATAPGSTAVNR